MPRPHHLLLLAFCTACSSSATRSPRRGDSEPGSLESVNLRAVRVPILEMPVAVDDSSDRVLVGSVRAERTSSGWRVSEEAAGGWIVAATRDGGGWVFVSWVGEVVRSDGFTAPSKQVGRIPAFVERQPSAVRLTVLGDDLRLYVADGSGGMPALESLGERAVVGAVFDGPAHGMVVDLGGELLETQDAARTWTPRPLAPGQAPEPIVARAAETVRHEPAAVADADVAPILAAVLARTGPLRGYGDGFVEALTSGASAIRLAQDRMVVIDGQGAAHPIDPPCPDTLREGPSLVSRCDDRAHVYDVATHAWVEVPAGREPGSSPFTRPDPDGPILREGQPVSLPEPDARWETGLNGDGSLFASLRDSDFGVAHPASIMLVSTDGTIETTTLPPGTSSFDFDGALGLAAGDTQTGARTTQALWATADRGRTWMPVDLPEGALLQYPHCLDGACFAGNVRVSRSDVPAMPTRQSTLDSPMPRMPTLRCTTDAPSQPPPDTQVTETAHATVHLEVGRDEQVIVRWRLAANGAEAAASGRIRGLIGDEETGAYGFLVSAVTPELVLFTANVEGRGAVQYLAKRGGTIAPAARGTPTPTAFGTDLPSGEWVWVEGDSLRTLARDGRVGPSIALHGRQPSGWAVVDGVAAPAIVVGLTPAFPIYAQLPTGTRRFAVRDAPLRGCASGATGARIGLLDSETQVNGANGTLMTEILVAPDGAACIVALSNPGATDGIGRLVATAPDRFEGVLLEGGAGRPARCTVAAP